MILLKYLFLLLSIHGLCSADESVGVCSSSGIWGKASPTRIQSGYSILPQGHAKFNLEIPNGYYVCYKTRTNRYFVGEEVVVCDDKPATVTFDINSHKSVKVIRNGSLQQDAAAYIIYYCDTKP